MKSSPLRYLTRERFVSDSLRRRKSPRRPRSSKQLKMATQTTSDSTVEVNKQLDRGFEFCGDIETVLFHLVLLTSSRRRFTISGTIMKLRESSSTVSGVNGKYDESTKKRKFLFFFVFDAHGISFQSLPQVSLTIFLSSITFA